MVYTQLRASLDQIWLILVGAKKMTSVLQDKRQKKHGNREALGTRLPALVGR